MRRSILVLLLLSGGLYLAYAHFGAPLESGSPGLETTGNTGVVGTVTTGVAVGEDKPAPPPETVTPEPRDREEVMRLRWKDLVPEDFHPERLLDSEKLAIMDDGDPKAKKMMEAYRAEVARAPTVASLHGRKVKIPGYVVPLDMDGTVTREFLLVPYFGACIHVPPPPANQVIHVVAVGEGTEAARSWYDTVWVAGRLTIERLENDMSDSAYTLAAERIDPYQEQEAQQE